MRINLVLSQLLNFSSILIKQIAPAIKFIEVSQINFSFSKLPSTYSSVVHNIPGFLQLYVHWKARTSVVVVNIKSNIYE